MGGGGTKEGRRLVALSHVSGSRKCGSQRKLRFTGRRCAPQGDETSPLLGPTAFCRPKVCKSSSPGLREALPWVLEKKGSSPVGAQAARNHGSGAVVRAIEVTRQEGGWWTLPWTAWLLEDGYGRACACAFTREGAIRSLQSKIALLDRPAPQIVHRELLPYEEVRP